MKGYFSGENVDCPESIVKYNLKLLENFAYNLKSINDPIDRHASFIKGHIDYQTTVLGLSRVVDSEGRTVYVYDTLINYLDNLIEFSKTTKSIEKGELPADRELYLDEYNKLDLSKKSCEEVFSNLNKLIEKKRSNGEDISPEVIKILSDIKWEINCLNRMSDYQTARRAKINLS